MMQRTLFRTLIAIFLISSLTACTGTITQFGTQALARAVLFDRSLEEESKPGLAEAVRPFRAEKLRANPAEEREQRHFLATTALLDERLTTIYEEANPAVVNIRVTTAPNNDEFQEWSNPNFYLSPEFPGVPFFDAPRFPELRPFSQHGQGSGFVYDVEGHIVTNHHVIDGADVVTVIFNDGSEAEAEVIGVDPNTDLAVIRVDLDEAPTLRSLPLGESDDLKVGQTVVSIGNPFGLSGSMSTGIVSGLGRVLPAASTSFTIPDIIQTDAAINPGNSGGPLLNLDGEVIGVNTAIQSRSGVFSGVGYAIPVDTVRRVVPELIENGSIQHPWLGIIGRSLDRETAEAMDLDPDQRGVLVVEIVADGPADRSGLQGSATQVTINGQGQLIGGDIITAVEGSSIAKFDDLLTTIVHQTAVGQTIEVEILRDGEFQTVAVTLDARPDSTS